MGIRFAKSIKIGNLLKVNLSTSGVSLSAGKSGASVNLGKNGTYLNLSPSLLGIKGTGVSYRQKVTGGYGSLLKSLTGQEETKKASTSTKKNTVTKAQVQPKEEVKPVDTTPIENYGNQLEARMNIHKYGEDVLNKEAFDNRINNLEKEGSKAVYQLLIDGDEDTIESTIGASLNNLDLDYNVKCNYELEDHILYVDLDLPEIEDFGNEYPCVQNNQIVQKKKTTAALKEEYGKTVLSLSIYLSSSFFNLSSYIDSIVLSAFTSRRNNDGDLQDDYLYSIKYKREVFEKVHLKDIEDAYQFMLQFENRINMSSTYTFKAIKPYESEQTIQANSIIDDAIDGLKELGYKAQDIQRILPELEAMNLEKAGDYIKEGLKLLSK